VTLAFTWWGHSSASVELAGCRVAIDPLLTDRLLHLARYGPTPGPGSADADVVLVSHLHADHCHLPSLARFAADVPIVVPRGGERLLARLGAGRLRPVAPGEVVEVGGVEVRVLPATHDGRRTPFAGDRPPALGFRVAGAGASFWYPGDTELREDMAQAGPVDLALVPVGGWGPTLGAGHMGPEDAAVAVQRVRARCAVPVHWGTFWPRGLARVARANHHRLFTTPGERFVEALADTDVEPLLATPGVRVEL
jgi:L-ascorbate metabolism protein UlaG (beta-lactamase superfamily)